MKKKILFWIIIAVIIVIIGLGFYLKFSSLGSTIMAIIFLVVGIIVGWLAKVFYDRYIADNK